MKTIVCRAMMEEAIIAYYEAAGFWSDVLDAEVKSMRDEKLMEVYLTL